MTRAETVEKVVNVLKRRFGCCLVEVPPGCNFPEVTRVAYEEVKKRSLSGVLLTRLSIDEVGSELQLVSELIRGWLDGQADATEKWRVEVESFGELPASRILLSFAGWTRRRGFRLLAVIGKFDKLFEEMSRELLATMRRLEEEKVLACMNVSVFPYNELYDRRMQRDPGFTSDYGQQHSRVTLGRLEMAEAAEAWQQRLGNGLDERLGRRYFHIAYEMSGGLPEAFEQAVTEMEDVGSGGDSFAPDIRGYRSKLSEGLQPVFKRLLQYDQQMGGRTLAEAVAKLHLGSASPLDISAIKQHRWSGLLLREVDGEHRLWSEALGRAAVRLLQIQRRGSTVDPVELYLLGEYGACSQVAEQVPSLPLLKQAADMLLCVFRDSPHDLYFAPETPWKRVQELATTAAKTCPDIAAAAEFERWARVSEIQQAVPPPDRRQIDRYVELLGSAGPRTVENAIVHIGIRLLAITRDSNTLTAVHVAIPLIEDVLRHYVAVVTGVTPIGSAFAEISDGEILPWWSSKRPFQRPGPELGLSAAQLAILAAVLSARKSHPLFGAREEVDRLLSALDVTRNTVGHYVTTPTEELKRKLVGEAQRLFERLCRDTKSTWSGERIEDLLRPPRLFLN